MQLGKRLKGKFNPDNLEFPVFKAVIFCARDVIPEICAEPPTQAEGSPSFGP